MQESANPFGAIAEQFGIETNGGFVCLADFYGDGLDDFLAWQIERCRKELPDIGFLPPIIDPILIRLARGVLIFADAVNGGGSAGSSARASVDAHDCQHQNASDDRRSYPHSREFAFIGTCSSQRLTI